VPRLWIEKMELDLHLADHSFQNAVFGLRSSQTIGSHFVTDRQLDISLANNLTSDARTRDRNNIVQQHLGALVPFLQNLNPVEVLHIRKNEGEAFVRFRQALNAAIDECNTINPQTFNTGDAVTIYQDILMPELARLNQVAEYAHKSVLKGTLRTAIACTAAITFGYVTGLLPADLLSAAKALGLVKVVWDLTDNTLKAQDASKDLEASPMYFLWKVKREATKWQKLEEKHGII